MFRTSQYVSIHPDFSETPILRHDVIQFLPYVKYIVAMSLAYTNIFVFGHHQYIVLR